MKDRRHHSHSWGQQLAAMIISPLAEKNPLKSMSSIAPIVLSMSRITVAVFTCVVASRIAYATTIGWPEATLAMAIIFAIPVLRALDKVSPQEVISFGTKIVERFGVGDVAQPPFPGMDHNEQGAIDDQPHPGQDA
jgi:hypothetical protein